jgi:hypothetical protein
MSRLYLLLKMREQPSTTPAIMPPAMPNNTWTDELEALYDKQEQVIVHVCRQALQCNQQMTRAEMHAYRGVSTAPAVHSYCNSYCNAYWRCVDGRSAATHLQRSTCYLPRCTLPRCYSNVDKYAEPRDSNDVIEACCDDNSRGDALVGAEALLLQLEHGGDNQAWPNCLQNEAQAERKRERHAEDCGCDACVKNGLCQARQERQPQRWPLVQ